MKRIALGLLLGAAVLYALATVLGHQHPGWHYLAAFAEAAMVGAVADWFAVVALFRHPLGLRIPHTAIIPTNKARIGRNLANFICNNFLGTPQVLAKVREFDAASRLAGWLANPRHAEQLAEHLSAAARYLLSTLDDERVRHFLRSTVLAKLEQLDVSALAGEMLALLTAERRHQALLDELLRQLAALLEDEGIQEKVAEIVASELRVLRVIGLDAVAGRIATRKLISALGTLTAEMGAEPDHPLRLRFDDFMAHSIERLREDPALRQRGRELQSEWLRHPALAQYLHGLWDQLLQWLQADLQRSESTLRARVAEGARTLGQRLQGDAAMREWINAQLMQAAPKWIERYREDIRAYIVARVDAWQTEELTTELERNIGRDLQFVRINGTLVGGLIGLLIHTLTVALGG
ncbi:DUF445 domain-containing protein [Azohydromonas sp. G-1-1-14]|uniref:DUF445 domain-containing protein n=2 Tax=Azohydromonas caseinilytica TaxID=2728836 RepID=A0A848F7B2_9BURK|nr:DUF445 domain-containing protein [Azohydromonas caseinilytica]